MKDSRFIELLNLYVDHQINAEDSALLEAEIHRDPERRRIYRQYCQMQKACVMLADSFRTETPVGGKIIEFTPARRRLQAVGWAVGALAAACVALVMVNRSSTNIPAAPASVAIQAPTNARPSTPMPLPARASLQPVFTAVVHDSAAATLAAASDREELDWMTRVQLQRVPQAQELWFESQPTLQPQDLSFPTRANAVHEQANGVAFRFQR